MSTSELATSYAALILADDGVDITADKLQSLIKAAKIEEVEPIWTTLFAKALEGKDVKDLLLNVGSGGGAAPAAGGAAPAAGGAADAAPAAEEKKEEGVGRGHGLRSLRLSVSFPFLSSTFAFLGVAKRIHQRAYSHCWGGTVTTIR
ncbi:hypothetical protein CC77DRAFT_226917 [Alternaria alternata]|uniref:Large ribosomal subunit protein P1 n=1 Tax=Alternaria alternata TaxID=5599 RepID=A0A177DEP8_ALTAL|nr:hypothetical protein CC77DRAFT_226917 [Alternaria alternata]OAG18314.1 hypothetical protein CC77DRAFT_226917 [Alternaria alternata]